MIGTLGRCGSVKLLHCEMRKTKFTGKALLLRVENQARIAVWTFISYGSVHRYYPFSRLFLALSAGGAEFARGAVFRAAVGAKPIGRGGCFGLFASAI